MNKTKYLIKNTGILAVCNFSSKILVFILVPLYTNVLSTTEYGTFDVAISTATLLYPILSLNIVDAVMRYTMDRDFNDKSVASIGAKFLVISMFLFSFVMYLLKTTKLWTAINGLEICILLFYVSYAFNQYLIQFAKGLEKIKYISIAGVISTIVTLLSNIVFLLLFKWKLRGFFYSNIIAQMVSAFYISCRIGIFDYLELKKTDYLIQKKMLSYSIPLIATVVCWWINSTADKFVVTFILGLSANGLLSVSYKIPQILNSFQSIFIQAWQISAINEYGGDDTPRFYGRIFSTTNLLMCIICSGLIVLTKPLAHLLYAKDFYLAWQYVPFLVISSLLNFASGLLGPILSAKRNTKAMMWSAIIGAGANIVMNIVFVYMIGMQGATIATLICSFIIYIIRKKAVDKEIRIEKYWTVLLSWGLLCLQAAAELYLSSYVLEIIVMIILLVINYSSLKQLSFILFKFAKKERSILQKD